MSGSLKDKVFDKIFPLLARGFVHYRKKELGVQIETEESLKDIYSATLTLLYRLLFILYAEARDLLPVEQQSYQHYSLARLKQKVADLQDKKSTLTELSTDLWSDLDTLFKIVDAGDPKLNVPTYNGGLFSQKNPKNDFLKTNRVPDPWLAEAFDYLTRDIDEESGTPQFIDYSELEVRHLGSVYEGLLEFYLKIADDDKAIIKEKGREVYKAVSEVKSPKQIVKKGELYLENDRHERKSTGSYYTPDYIVTYIVQNAVGPVLKEKLEKVEKLFVDVESLRAKARKATAAKRHLAQELNEKKRQAADELFSLKILDPAMGSGHFLVETVDFLSDYIIKFLTDHPENPVLETIQNLRATILSDLKKKGISINDQRLTPTNLVRRMVMKRCIYGVDLNPMAVELAKLSLWLHSFTLGAPLSFLDHHLKYGNSLIGAKVGDVREKMQTTLFGNQFAGLLSATELMQQVGELTDSTFEEVQESQQKFEQAADALKPFHLILDLWTSEYFGNNGAQDFLTHGGDVETFLKGNNGQSERIKKLRHATESCVQATHFFHWELQFPEVFYEGAKERIAPGFDAVVGNPPWGAALQANEKRYVGLVYPITAKNFDTYIAMIAKDIGILREGGTLGYIVPDAWLTGVSYVPLRKFLLANGILQDMVNLPYDVFADAYVDTVTIIFSKRAGSNQSKFGNVGVINFGKREPISDINNHLSRRVYIDSKIWAADPYVAFRISLSPADYSIENKLTKNVVELGSIVSIDRGLEAYSRSRQSQDEVERRIYHSRSKLDDSYIKQFRGDLRRYHLVEGEELWVKWGKHLAEYPDIEFFQKPRILLRRLISRQFRLMATYTEATFANDSSTFNLILRDQQYHLLFLLAVLNSHLLSHFQIKRSQLAQRDDFPKLSLEEARSFPIRRIVFSTDKTERAHLLNKAQTLHERCVAKTDFLCVMGFVDHCLTHIPEMADVVHDLLGFLARQMVEMNRQKQDESKGFLDWLEATIGVKVDTLKNKTKLAAYYDGTLEELLDVLKENKKVLKINPASKEFFDPVKDAFEKSLAKLSPLKRKVATTDRLIDLIVYRLYGLTDEEIKQVEGEALSVK